MPRHLISDAHERINEIPTVPIYLLANPLHRERTMFFFLESAGKEDPVEFDSSLIWKNVFLGVDLVCGRLAIINNETPQPELTFFFGSYQK
jgi:hypothetical protein